MDMLKTNIILVYINYITNPKREMKKEIKEKMNQILYYYKNKLSKIRIGKANTDMLDDITVEYYKNKVPLYHLSSLEVINSKTILIKPWEKKTLALIEKSIIKSNLGILPINKGKFLKLVIPSLTEERRKEIIKSNKLKLETAKISLRNIRKDYNNKIIKEFSETDLIEKYKKDVLEATKEYIYKIEKIFENKNKEILKI
ncbi:ribosome recycling factor [Candidatus Karelsulcia muelleri]|uniref:ribosome recycling factor n=1 Tax=Candidatus Karelsulcia muelleri TaxID=336810 RepID=UPI00194EE05A|nr:ribosome recycling factor [Candidatus Karelsulcia muelleri]